MNIPAPTTFVQIVWALIGFFFARAFGKQLDQDIQNSSWFNNLNEEWKKNFIKRLLDFTHHLWLGLLIMIMYGSSEIIIIGRLQIAPYWIGYGWVIDDAPDIPPRFRKYFSYLLDK